jgi:hypothetical protein
MPDVYLALLVNLVVHGWLPPSALTEYAASEVRDEPLPQEAA